MWNVEGPDLPPVEGSLGRTNPGKMLTALLPRARRHRRDRWEDYISARRRHVGTDDRTIFPTARAARDGSPRQRGSLPRQRLCPALPSESTAEPPGMGDQP